MNSRAISIVVRLGELDVAGGDHGEPVSDLERRPSGQKAGGDARREGRPPP